MLKIKSQLKYNQITIPITINNNNNLSGFQQEINNIIYDESIKSINKEKDVEVKRYKNKHFLSFINFYFYNYTTHTYSSLFTNAGFTDSEIENKNSNFINSYFVVLLYDNFDSKNQNLIYVNYITKFYNENSIFESNKNNEFYYLLTPNYYKINDDIITGYTKYLFYNAKTGKYHLFYNTNNENLTTEQKYYFYVEINTNDNIWNYPNDYDTSGFLPSLNIKEDINATEYINKINNNDIFINKKQQYPNGYIFKTDDGKYTNIGE